MNTTVKIDPDIIRKRIENLKKHHEATFKKIDYDVFYKPTMCYRPKGKDSKHISFFISELKIGQDIYTEFVSREYISEDPTRTLYKWNYNPQWQEVYDSVKKDGITERYYIPISELVVIPRVEPGIDESLLELSNPEIDAPMDQMTIRDYYAIHHQKPVSQKKWLNEIITKYK